MAERTTSGEDGMAKFIGLYGALVASVVAAGLSSAGTIRNDRADSLYTNLAANPAFDSVGRFNWTESNASFVASGSLIRSDWVLTAAHVVDGTNGFGSGISNLRFQLDGNVYSAAEWIPHPNWALSGGENNLFAGWDVGLVRLNSAITDVKPARLFNGSNELGRQASLVGFGATGNGLTGTRPNSAGVKRAGTNTVDVVGGAQTFGSNPAFRFGHDRLIAVDFDRPNVPTVSTLGNVVPLDLEYLTAPGDSGGGLFIEVGGEQLLAGVTSLGSTVDGDINSSYGDRASFSRVSAFTQWIEDTIAAVASPELAGDYNLDGLVDVSDFNVWRDTLGQVVPAFDAADGNGSGIIDVGDYELWRSQLSAASLTGASFRASVNLPEPNALSIALCLGLAAVVRRRTSLRGASSSLPLVRRL